MRRAVADGLGRELDDRAGLDVPAGADVMADAGRHRAERLALIVPVRVDDGDRQPRPHLHDEAADGEHLLGPQRQLRVRLRADHAVGVEPDVVDAHLDQPAQPGFGHELDVGLADARGDADEQPVAAAGLEARSVLVSTCSPAAALVADDLGAFDADERRDVAEPRELARDLVGDELPVGEDLEVAVGMRGEEIEQLRMQERLAAEDAEVGVAVRLGVADDAVQLVERELLRGRRHVHPAALAAQLTAGDDRDEEERREVLAAPPPPLVELDRAHALDAEVVDELRHHLRLGLGQHALGQREQHDQASAAPRSPACESAACGRAAAPPRPSP